VLDELDRELEERGHRFVRYADDCNIYVRSERAGHRVMKSATRFLESRLRLSVNQAKSAVARSGERHFVGFRLARKLDGTVEVHLSKRSRKRIDEKIRQLIRLSKEQGYLTFDDINEALPESIENQEEIDNVLSILQNLEIEILEPDQVEDYKQRQEEAEEEESRSSQNDILDDPVRMYLKQMGQVPLLTREQEVEISKRIENAELKAQEALFQASAVGGYIAVLGAKLLNREERFDRIVIDKKIESRDAYFRTLPKLVESTQKSEAGTKEVNWPGSSTAWVTGRAVWTR